MKTPISYYGGKQSMLGDILPMLPIATAYIESFFGGGAVFFAKEKAKFEVINDLNQLVVNFYEHCKNIHLFEALQVEIANTFMTRNGYDKSKLILANPRLFSSLERAWAFWFCVNFSFNNSLDGGYKNTTTKKETTKLLNKIEGFDSNIYERLKNVEIENIDAVDLIQKRDKEDTFFYIDPPYLNANQGHYKGYTHQNFEDLLEILSNIKGKFLLSCFDTKYLKDFIKKNNWTLKKLEKHTSASMQKKTKTELLIHNY